MSNLTCCCSMATAACIWHIDFPHCSLEAFGVFGLTWRIMLLPKRHSTSGLPMTAPYLPHSFLLCKRQADQNRNLSDKNGTYHLSNRHWISTAQSTNISTTEMGVQAKKEQKKRGNWNFTLIGLFWIDSPAMAKVKNAMFFTVKESCIKLAAGYGNTEINDRLNMYRHVWNLGTLTGFIFP